MARQFDLAQVVRFVPTANGHGVDAIVTHPSDTSRVATESICSCWAGEKAEFVVAALEYYRTHVMLQAQPKLVGGWLDTRNPS
jgi:hypothetical protein